MQQMTSDTRREAFEEWWKEANPHNSLERAKIDQERYFTAFADYGWRSWQACGQHWRERLAGDESINAIGRIICGKVGKMPYDVGKIIARAVIAAILKEVEK